VTRDLCHGTGGGQGGFLESRVHSLDLGQALLEAARLFRELAQLLGDHLVVIHRLEMIPLQSTDSQLGGGAPDCHDRRWAQ
jgi:hypothetical protein